MAYEPSLGELERLIERNHMEVREDILAVKSELSRLVLREVYQSDEARRSARFEAIEAELKRASNTRILLATLAITAFIGPILVGVIVFMVTRGLK